MLIMGIKQDIANLFEHFVNLYRRSKLSTVNKTRIVVNIEDKGKYVVIFGFSYHGFLFLTDFTFKSVQISLEKRIMHVTPRVGHQDVHFSVQEFGLCVPK